MHPRGALRLEGVPDLPFKRTRMIAEKIGQDLSCSPPVLISFYTSQRPGSHSAASNMHKLLLVTESLTDFDFNTQMATSFWHVSQRSQLTPNSKQL